MTFPFRVFLWVKLLSEPVCPSLAHSVAHSLTLLLPTTTIMLCTNIVLLLSLCISVFLSFFWMPICLFILLLVGLHFFPYLLIAPSYEQCVLDERKICLSIIGKSYFGWTKFDHFLVNFYRIIRNAILKLTIIYFFIILRPFLLLIY